MATNITWHHSHITRSDRERHLNQRGVTLWFTGLSGSGKSTIATALERELVRKHKKATYVLDGDNIRHGLNKDLGFGPGDRQENIRRIGEVCNLFVDAGMIVMAAFVSPYKEDRDKVRVLLNETNERKIYSDENNEGQNEDSMQKLKERTKNFIEIYVKADVSTCEERDPKGLYKRARSGEIKNFTGISAPFEEPDNPEVILDSKEKYVDECVSQLMTYLRDGGYLSACESEDR